MFLCAGINESFIDSSSSKALVFSSMRIGRGRIPLSRHILISIATKKSSASKVEILPASIALAKLTEGSVKAVASNINNLPCWTKE